MSQVISLQNDLEVQHKVKQSPWPITDVEKNESGSDEKWRFGNITEAVYTTKNYKRTGVVVKCTITFKFRKSFPVYAMEKRKYGYIKISFRCRPI